VPSATTRNARLNHFRHATTMAHAKHSHTKEVVGKTFRRWLVTVLTRQRSMLGHVPPSLGVFPLRLRQPRHNLLTVYRTHVPSCRSNRQGNGKGMDDVCTFGSLPSNRFMKRRGVVGWWQTQVQKCSRIPEVVWLSLVTDTKNPFRFQHPTYDFFQSSLGKPIIT
jgi:hypothetical protein